ncbi:hypothetical protein [Mycobacteroides abscessus]|uniref:hypothetical protein n=1 Tax=Mycobacteroides abscessus TaxID=36809 RepID=UPI0009A6116F|nr:hypothetical protein [Mycobacteroides abscessus]MBN7314135.1 hypothetical protein [Mycobacteroides abscessus subsp. abscessus]SKG10572.1 Uncharacterised protein [Mycobacteroides abscessus subsp. massiliense]
MSNDIDYLDQAGAILTALKRIIGAKQKESGRQYPTKDEWLTIDRAIKATGFDINAAFSSSAVREWQSTLESGLR